MGQVVVIKPVVRRNPDKVVDAVVDHAENDVDAFRRLRRTPVRDAYDVEPGRADTVQASGHGSRPDPAVFVFAEGRYRIVYQRRVGRVVVPEQAVADLLANAIFGGRQPEGVPAVDEHRANGCRGDNGCRAYYLRKIDNLEGLPLDDGEPFRLQADPDLPVPGGDAPYQFSREECVPVLVRTGAVHVERLVGSIENADASQGAGHDLAVRRETESADFVIRN